MKFEDLKLLDWSGPYQVVAIHTARAIYDQMREHYETKLAEAKPEPEELFEHPDMPGKKFRRLKVGETIEETDMFSNEGVGPMKMTERSGFTVVEWSAKDYYREVPQPAPEWRLPDPPPGSAVRTTWEPCKKIKS